MSGAENIAEGIYLIGGPNISRSDDATVFIVDFGGELVMIDSGAGRSAAILQKNMEGAGLDLKAVSTLILTHCHIDHIGSAPWVRDQSGCRIVMHDPDADAVEEGDPEMTAAGWYGTVFPPTRVDRRLTGDHEIMHFGNQELHCLHTPGHTPGSMSFWFPAARLLIAGDTLFRRGIGRTDLWGGDYASIERSIKQRLYRLDEDATVVTGHGPDTRLGDEMRENPFVRA